MSLVLRKGNTSIKFTPFCLFKIPFVFHFFFFHFFFFHLSTWQNIANPRITFSVSNLHYHKKESCLNLFIYILCPLNHYQRGPGLCRKTQKLTNCWLQKLTNCCQAKGGKWGADYGYQSVSQSVSSFPQLCPTLCDLMNPSMPGLPVHHQLPEYTQTHVHRVGDAIQPSHPLSSRSSPAPNHSQHESFPVSQLFSWGGQSTGVSALASFLPKKSQGWSPSEWTGWISL